jgi:uncharacterized protein with NAD-binding domain and iron-sulfur cluster
MKVIILGGGVAGLSAAHELIDRNFEVEVFERQEKIPGGKARSIPVPNSAKDGRKPLPGEHGFRFFPGFYRHITDTMSRIPYKKGSVLENLVETYSVMITRYGEPPIVALNHFPTSREDLKIAFSGIIDKNTGLDLDDIEFFVDKIWQLMTSSYERRNEVYEKIGWWEYLDADNPKRGDAYRQLFVLGLTRSLVAAKAETVSTKTVGDIFLQLLFDTLDPFKRSSTDRLLNGPTNDVWINPWLEHLKSKGVKYNFNAVVEKFNLDQHELKSVSINVNGQLENFSSDFYISAIPVEQFAKLIDKDMLLADSTFRNIQALSSSVNWMNGIQFYLNKETPINRGHIIHADTEWALTSISQNQFWKDIDLSKYGNGKVKEIISVDISDWFVEGLNGRKASECSVEEIKNETWKQLCKSINYDKVILDDSMLENIYLDRDIDVLEFKFESTASNKNQMNQNFMIQPDWEAHLNKIQNSFKTINKEPLLINRVNTWVLRPDSFTGVNNLFLAADFVRTNTDLATMEGANEAARRAVNCIITESNSKAKLCKIWDLHEPFFLSVLRKKDKKNYAKGLPWQKDIPIWAKFTIFLLKKIGNIIKKRKR